MNKITGYSFLFSARAFSWRAFTAHWSSSFFLMDAYSALFSLNARFSDFLLLFSLSFINYRLNGVTVFIGTVHCWPFSTN